MASIEIDGANQKIKLDSDGDTFVEAATDDTIKVNVAGAEDLRITSNAINVLSGTTLTIDSGATITNSGTASGFASAADDISTGDAAVTIATSTGNITIDAQGDDTDIIFKGTDGGADTTFLTIDGSAAGAAAFNAGATFGSNVTITTADNSDTLTLKCTDDDANTGPVLNLLRDSASPADGDQIGRIDFSAESDLGSETNYGVIKAFSDDVSHGVENGVLSFHTRIGGSEVERLNFSSSVSVFNDSGANVDFRVESDSRTEGIFIDAGNDNLSSGTTAGAGALSGDSSSSSGLSYEIAGFLCLARSGNPTLRLNRSNGDGGLQTFASQGTIEGTISISGSTTSYGSFCGTHWSRLEDNSKPTILRGTVLESIAKMCEWYQVEYNYPVIDSETKQQKKDDDGNLVFTTVRKSIDLPDGGSVGDNYTYKDNGVDYTGKIIKESNEQLPMCKISDTEDSKGVYGVFMAWDDDDDGTTGVNDMYVASLGEFVVRIHKDETIAIGDYLQSKGDGTAKKQADDILRSSTIAKVTSTEKTITHSDGSYCVPCTLHCG